MKVNEKMPELRIVQHKDYNQKFEDSKFKMFYNNWHSSLQPCEISESELDKVKNKLSSIKLRWDSIIEVTDIVEEKICETYKMDECNSRFSCCNKPKQLIFKQSKTGTNNDYESEYQFYKKQYDRLNNPKQVEEIESFAGYVAFNVNGIVSGIYSNLEWLKEDYPKSGYYKLTTLRNI